MPYYFLASSPFVFIFDPPSSSASFYKLYIFWELCIPLPLLSVDDSVFNTSTMLWEASPTLSLHVISELTHLLMPKVSQCTITQCRRWAQMTNDNAKEENILSASGFRTQSFTQKTTWKCTQHINGHLLLHTPDLTALLYQEELTRAHSAIIFH